MPTRRIIASLLLAAVAACATQREPLSAACPVPQPCPACPICPAPPPEARKVAPLEPASFADLPGWRDDDLGEAWSAFTASCRALRFRDAWQAACARAGEMQNPSRDEIRAYFEALFVPYRVQNPDGTAQGLVTGYYEPLLRGSREKRAPFLTPLYGPPDDLLVIDLGEVAPETRTMRLRGRLEGRKVVPYYARADIERGVAPVAGKEVVWVDDPVEAFFLHIQGSGRVQLSGGETVRVGYADQNGHPYQSIGRYLVDSGELKLEQASMQGIQAWARAHPERVEALLNRNPSYVFFRELPAPDAGPGSTAAGPLGALGVPLTPERSIAVDPRVVPLGAPVYLATTRPNTSVPLTRLVMAQDTGGAIRGAVRADFFWGFGAEAGREAGRMRQQGRMWVLLPKAFVVKAP